MSASNVPDSEDYKGKSVTSEMSHDVTETEKQPDCDGPNSKAWSPTQEVAEDENQRARRVSHAIKTLNDLKESRRAGNTRLDRIASAKESVFQEAERITSGNRNMDYGPAERCNGNIADQWSLYLWQKHGVKVTLDYADVSWMMADLKKVRQMNFPKRDNLVDAIGYIGLVDATK